MYSKDFSLFALFTAGLATIAEAVVMPVGPEPVGNPFRNPTAGTIVTAGQPVPVKWDPTTPRDGLITLLVCKGPPSACNILEKPIVEHIPNSGEYTWTPSSDLVPTPADVGYGLVLVVEANGQYQYTNQFGVKNPSYGSGSGSSSSSSKSSASPSHSATGHGSQSPTYGPTATPTTSRSTTPSSSASTGFPSSIVSPNPTPSVPTTLSSSTTTGSSTTSLATGAAAAPTMGARMLVGMLGMGVGALVL